VAGVHVHHGERQRARVERLAREVQEHGAVLAAREEQHCTLELRGHLADHVNGLGLEGPQM
jgi:hypothetical protein